ncbi:pyridoxamine 5'-phosphate oxidase family protein [Stomatobaculum longum]|uniref:pyridoxamine 5'-phosphate oxidase family protein n=1 Tax=Stomatobaculum longum TaxID=796942 RepID=UPI0028EEBD22|nr:pyridoxamine 5'-phosphate oxidase family protein [Stomatobaculum longum]
MRRNDREVRDRAEIQRILEVAKVLRLGLTDGDYPYIVPLHYGYVYADDVLRFYMHGAKAGKKLALAMSNPHAFVEFDCEVETTGEGDIACVYGANYASLMARGEVTVVEDPEENAHVR